MGHQRPQLGPVRPLVRAPGHPGHAQGLAQRTHLPRAVPVPTAHAYTFGGGPRGCDTRLLLAGMAHDPAPQTRGTPGQPRPGLTVAADLLGKRFAAAGALPLRGLVPVAGEERIFAGVAGKLCSHSLRLRWVLWSEIARG